MTSRDEHYEAVRELALEMDRREAALFVRDELGYSIENCFKMVDRWHSIAALNNTDRKPS